MTTEEQTQRENIFSQITLLELEKKQLLDKANKEKKLAIQAVNELASSLENYDLADHQHRRQVRKGLHAGEQAREQYARVQNLLYEILECEGQIRGYELELHNFDVKHSSEYVTA